MEKSVKTRIESDLLGSREVPEEALYGVQTLRALENNYQDRKSVV